MSGTSFDGVDAAIIKTDGQYFIKTIESIFIKYSNAEKSLIIIYLKTIKNY